MPCPAVDDHLLLVLKDIGLTNGEPAAHDDKDWMDGKEGDLVTVKGEVRLLLLTLALVVLQAAAFVVTVRRRRIERTAGT